MKIKINYLEFKNFLELLGKTYFHLADLQKFYSGNKSSLKPLLANWSKKGLIYHLGQGFYTFNIALVDYLALANQLDDGSYISFESALSFHNLIDQVPSIATLATKNRSRIVKLSRWTFEYSHLKPELIFDYELRGNIYIATPEKALADLFYLAARGKRLVELDTLEKNKINRKELTAILKKFPVYVAAKSRQLLTD